MFFHRHNSRRQGRATVAAVLVWFAFVAVTLVSASATADTHAGADGLRFDHFSTGFPLTGVHSAVTCDACHIRGVMRGTPKLCAGCHNGSTAVGKRTDHVPTNASCDTCHSTTGTSFAITGNFDHADMTAGCAACHAKDRPASHIPTPTGADCGLCHRASPFTFQSAPLFDHGKVSMLRCDGCHNGSHAVSGAVGKSTNHPPTPPGQDCGACHNTQSFSDLELGALAFDHSGVTSGCNTCHLKDKPPVHIPVPAGSECVLCHRVAPDTFANAANFNHALVSMMRCDTCHSGAFVAAGAIGKSATHPPIPAGKDCAECHRTTLDFATLNVDHGTIITGCNSCHLSDKPASHVPVPAGSECVLCHRVAPDVFTNAASFNHSNVSTMRCDACHNGTYSGAGAIGKTSNHIPTSAGQDCNVCHTNTVSFAGATFNHSGVTTGCNTCHLTDKPANHIPVPAGSQCVLCHRVAPDVFTNAATFNHSNVSAMRCDACHNGAYSGAGAIGKTSSHIPTSAGQDCNACHLNTLSFAGATFNHSGVTTGCNSCHLRDKPANHIPVPTGSECVLCHRVAPDTFTNAATFNHSNVSTMRCDSCHSGAFTGAGAIGKTPSHPTTTPGQDCNACHLNTLSFAGAGFNHSGVTTGCNSCHLRDKPASHIPVPTGSECVLCHRVAPDTFTNAATFNHSNVSTLRCDSCHSGAFTGAGAIGKSSGHPATTPGQDCNACHLNTLSFAGAGFNHSGVTTGCNGCHLSDKPSNHLPVPAGSECYLCHRVAPDSFGNAGNFSHSKVTAMRCDTCHSGAYRSYGAEGKPGDHPRVSAGQDCNASGCHRSTNDW